MKYPKSFHCFTCVQQFCSLHLRVAQLVAAWQPGCEKMENEKMKRKWREIHSLHFLIFFLFPPPPLSISYIKNCIILSRNVKYGPFVANVIKNLASLLNENEIIQALELFTPLVYMKRKRLLLLCQNSMLSLYFLKDHSWSLP